MLIRHGEDEPRLNDKFQAGCLDLDLRSWTVKGERMFHTVSAEKWNKKCLRCGCSNIVACGMALSSGRPIAYKELMAEVALQENRTTTA